MSAEFLERVSNGGKVEPRGQMTSLGLSRSVGMAALLMVVQISAFSVLRSRASHVYAGRTCLSSQELYVPPPVGGPLAWVKETYRYSTYKILQLSGLDAYFFLRYIVFLITLLSVQAILLIPVLVPMHATGRAETDSKEKLNTVLEQLSIANISESKSERHAAHLVMSSFVLLACYFLFRSELYHFHKVRADYLASRVENDSSSTTILLKGIHPIYQDELRVREYFGNVGKHIVNVWINRDCRDLEKLTRRQAVLTDQLESTIVELIKRCEAAVSSGATRSNKEFVLGEEWRHYLDDKDLPSAGWFRSVSITALKNELSHVNAQIELLRAQRHLFPASDSCFIQFDSRTSCFMAFRSIGIGVSKQIAPCAFKTDRAYPEDVIWTNLHRKNRAEVAYLIAAVTLEYTIIFGWALPMALLSMVTQVEYIVQLIPALDWLIMFPGIAPVVDGILSPFLLSYLTSQVPMIFRQLALWKGYSTRTLIESDVQTYLFIFLYVQLFLIVTLGTGLPTLTIQLALNTTEGVMTLASTLPKATNFFISYLITTCCMMAGTSLLQFGELFMFMWRALVIRTPRQRITHLSFSPRILWGTVYPMITHMGAIAMTYSLISPMILTAPILGLPLVYMSFKYRMVYSYIPRSSADGTFYPRAILQLFSGIYCSQISLFGTCIMSKLPIYSIICLLLILATMLTHHRLSCLFHDLDSRVPLETGQKFDERLSPLYIGSGSSRCHSPGTVDAQCLSARRSHFQNFVLLDTHQDSSEFYEQHPNEQKASLFQHPCLRPMSSCVWIPHDLNGIALDQVNDIRQHYPGLMASCSGAQISRSGTIRVTKLPPDSRCTRLAG